ncbi:hypothetical protein OHA84_36760 [Streptomyces sp. NBC_00513]|uniref:hypothetical protein n=1 Tax=unclassified Streptomyces TaxID=2593676 RepID=UPI002259E25B|nr:hypothetical protein [Streptomyces sp. NBC_00424]MCX5078672.1 hypothetical protein [Streptomyces sp. NBC_00424]WUD39115.1 hypothetical protein OHA84_00540 [Streptomyces sp. NBC_00513]WUD45614.1 hypothetical protein OHA84_36760 [Streptomyces sp. NBC_00513]
MAVSRVMRRVYIAVAAVSAAAVVGLILAVVLVDLDTADRVASIIGAMIAAISLAVSMYTLNRPTGVAVAGARSVQAGGSIRRAVTGDNNRQQGPPAEPQPPAAGPSPSATTTVPGVPGERGVAAGGSIGEAITGDGNQQT